MFKSLLAIALALSATAVLAAVDVNTASQAELESLQGIGPALSSRILDERKKALFKDWSDLTERIKGLGPGHAVKLSKAGMTVNGATYDGAASDINSDKKTQPITK